MHDRTNQFRQKYSSQIFCRYGAAFKLTVEKEKQQKLLQVESQEVDESNKKSLQKLNQRLIRLRNNLQIADAMVYEGNEQLQKFLCSPS